MVFVALVFVPVYHTTLFADPVLFNAIQFWTGESPIKLTRAATGDTLEVGQAEQTTTVAFDSNGRGAVRTMRGGRLVHVASLVIRDLGMGAFDDHGEVRASAVWQPDGDVVLLDQDKQLLHRLSSEEVRAAASWLATLR